MPVGDLEYDEVIEEYEEEIFAQEEAQEPVSADPADSVPAQGKPQSIIHIFMITKYIFIYMWCAFKLHAFYGNYLHKHTYPWVLLVQVE